MPFERQPKLPPKFMRCSNSSSRSLRTNWLEAPPNAAPKYGVRYQSARAGAATLPINSNVSAVLSSGFIALFIRDTPKRSVANGGPPISWKMYKPQHADVDGSAGCNK